MKVKMTVNHYHSIVPLTPSSWGKWDSIIHGIKCGLKVRNKDLCLHKHCLYIWNIISKNLRNDIPDIIRTDCRTIFSNIVTTHYYSFFLYTFQVMKNTCFFFKQTIAQEHFSDLWFCKQSKHFLRPLPPFCMKVNKRYSI